jgi:hypothetical protein
VPFNENSRVKIPALIHLTRLGYTYLSLKGPAAPKIDPTTNIFIDIFHQSLNKIFETVCSFSNRYGGYLMYSIHTSYWRSGAYV